MGPGLQQVQDMWSFLRDKTQPRAQAGSSRAKVPGPVSGSLTWVGSDGFRLASQLALEADKYIHVSYRLPRWLKGKEPICQC